MSLIGLILTFALVGFVLWLVLTYIPMPAPFKQVLIVIVVILLILWCVNVTGLLGGTALTRPIRF